MRSEAPTEPAGEKHALRRSTDREAVDLDFGGQNPMLVITVDASSQAPYRSFPCKHENSFIPLLLLFPKSLTTFREPWSSSLAPLFPNIVPIPESHRSVAALRRHKLHITRPAVNGRSRSFRCASSPLKIFDFAGTPFFGGESWHGHILFVRSFSFPLR